MQLALLICYPLLAHYAVLKADGLIAAIAMLFLVVGILLRPLISLNRLALIVFSIAVAIVVAGYLGAWSTQLLKLPPLVFPLLLFGVFAYSLLPGREAIVTQVGEVARGPLSKSMRRYTRRVTQTWALFFLGLIVIACLSAVSSVPGRWSWITNVLGYPLAGLIFVGEFFLRKQLFPDHDHPTFFQYVRIVVSANIGRPGHPETAAKDS